MRWNVMQASQMYRKGNTSATDAEIIDNIDISLRRWSWRNVPHLCRGSGSQYHREIRHSPLSMRCISRQWCCCEDKAFDCFVIRSWEGNILHVSPMNRIWVKCDIQGGRLMTPWILHVDLSAVHTPLFMDQPYICSDVCCQTLYARLIVLTTQSPACEMRMVSGWHKV